jgi:hypothetical protein
MHLLQDLSKALAAEIPERTAMRAHRDQAGRQSRAE